MAVDEMRGAGLGLTEQETQVTVQEVCICARVDSHVATVRSDATIGFAETKPSVLSHKRTNL